MNELFGIPMNTIMFVLVVLFVVCASAFVWTFLANRIMFRMGLRNIGRRRSQSVLVVAGLMLATVIITASFATGDTLDRSITNVAYDNLQRIDLSLHHFRSGDEPEDTTDVAARYYVPAATVGNFERAFANDPDIEGFIPSLFEGVPVLNGRSKQTEPTVIFSGIEPATVERFGGIHAAGGGRADLSALKADEVYLNETAADALDARKGDDIVVYARDQSFNLRVAGIVKDERLSGALDFGGEGVSGMVGLLPTVQSITGHEGQISSINIVLRGDVRSSLERSAAAEERLKAFKDDEARKTAAGLGGVSFQVEANKKDAVDAAELFGNIFTTMFLVLGLFSIAAGIMLIFTLFIMLAAERRTEMGIARAVGAERSHIVQAFLAEGMVYDFVAGLIGVVLGVAVAAVVIVGGTRLAFGDTLSFIRPYVSLQTLVISFCLGAVLTFITVVVSAVRISQLNIVAAVRGQQDRRTGREARRATSWRWVGLGVPMMLLLPPLGLYWLLRKGFGLPLGLVVGPSGLVFAALSIWLGVASGLYFPFSMGISLIPLSAAALARYYGAPARLTWTATGVLLAAYWLAPEGATDWLFRVDLSGSMEMFVLSGIMIVTALTLIIVYNARLITTLYASAAPGAAKYRTPAVLFLAVVALAALGVGMGDAASGLGELAYLAAIFVGIFLALSVTSIRFPRFAPALKMGVAYPLASRLRTGITIAMFSIVIFSITVMGIINNAFLEMFAGEEGRGGWDIYAETNRNNPVPDLQSALAAEGSFDPAQVAVVGRTSVFDRFREVRKAGDEKWEEYPVLAGDDAWFGQSEMKLEGRARGYASDADVWRALKEKPNTALVPSDIVSAQGGDLGASSFHVAGVSFKDDQFEPFDLEFRDPATGKTGRVTVIGVATSKIPTGMLIGMFVNEQTYRPVFGAPEYATLFVRLQPGVDPQQAARGIEAALVEKGVQADSIKKLIDDAMAQSRGFLRVMQVFMGLGLLVGIASLGVIALRAVVERRQQIGMLRAIGYQRSTVALSFLLESGFVALMGIIAGIGGAAILSYNLLQTDTFTGTTALTFAIPWVDVVAYGVISFLFAMLMTWWPSRRAASVPIAEALRYE